MRLEVDGAADRRRRRARARARPRRADAARGGGRRRRDARGRRARERDRAGDPGARATRSRTAVAMSGGVDSAVALLAAGDGRRRRDAPALDRSRAPRRASASCCSPAAVIAARETCHRLGHPARDARPARGVPQRGRRSRSPRATRAARRRTRASAATARFRFDELLAFARRVGAARLATGHYARIVERDGRLAIARAADPRKDQSYMLATLDPGVLDRLWFPLGEQTKDETRAAGRGRRARRRAPAREPGGLLPRRRRLPRRSSAAAGSRRRRGRSSTRAGRSVGTHDGFWRFTPGQRRGLGVAAAEPLYARRDRRRGRTRSSSARAPSLARTPRHGRAAGSTRARRAVEAKLRHRSPRSPRRSSRRRGGFELLLDEPAYGVAPGQTAVALRRTTRSSGAGVIVGSAERVRSPRCSQHRASRHRRLRPRGLPDPDRARARLRAPQARRRLRPHRVVHPQLRARGDAGDQQGRRHRRPRQLAARQDRPGDRQRRRRGRGRRRGRPRRQLRGQAADREARRARRRRLARLRDARASGAA